MNIHVLIRIFTCLYEYAHRCCSSPPPLALGTSRALQTPCTLSLDADLQAAFPLFTVTTWLIPTWGGKDTQPWAQEGYAALSTVNPLLGPPLPSSFHGPF